MIHQANLLPAEAPVPRLIARVHGSAKDIGKRVADFFAVCADSWAAADLYQDLSRLSDAELQRRGIPRGEIHRCVFEALTKPASRS
jgi:hypothetical protein